MCDPDLSARLALCSPSAAITCLPFCICIVFVFAFWICIVYNNHHHGNIHDNHLGPGLPRRLGFRGHRPLQLLWHSHILHLVIVTTIMTTLMLIMLMMIMLMQQLRHLYNNVANSNNITYQNWEWYSPQSESESYSYSESESELTSTRSTFTPQGSVASSSADWYNDQYYIFGPAFGPSGLLDFVLHALRALRPCDHRLTP